jgi:hypothetical protein
MWQAFQVLGNVAEGHRRAGRNRYAAGQDGAEEGVGEVLAGEQEHDDLVALPQPAVLQEGGEHPGSLEQVCCRLAAFVVLAVEEGERKSPVRYSFFQYFQYVGAVQPDLVGALEVGDGQRLNLGHEVTPSVGPAGVVSCTTNARKNWRKVTCSTRPVNNKCLIIQIKRPSSRF